MLRTITTAAMLLVASAFSAYASDAQECILPSYGLQYSSKSFEVPFGSLVSFGDSFSDVGTIFEATGGLQPPPEIAWKGRWTNGRNWVDKMALYFRFPEMQANVNGFAFAGATSTDFWDSYAAYPVPSVELQIQMYLQANVGKADSNVLYTILIGHNDYYYYTLQNVTNAAAGEAPTEPDFDKVVSMVAGFVLDQAQTLYDQGARHILVANVIDMQKSPEVLSRDPNVKEAYQYMIPKHNRLLWQLLGDFEKANPNATIYRLDYYQAMHCLDQQAVYYGLDPNQLQEPCYPDQMNVTNDQCDDPFAHKWWDNLHPSTHAHQVLAAHAIESIFQTTEGPPADAPSASPATTVFTSNNCSRSGVSNLKWRSFFLLLPFLVGTLFQFNMY